MRSITNRLGWYAALPILAVVISGGLRQKFVRQSMGSVRPADALYRAETIKKISFGFDSFLAACLWVQLLQSARTEKIDNDMVSWEFAQADVITTLDRRFIHAYRLGSVFLSVFRQDKNGARLLLEKWVRHFPNMWVAHAMLGYHLYAEMSDYHGAAPHVLKAASMQDAPAYLASLGIRLLSEQGVLSEALRMAVELYDEMPGIETRYRLSRRIRSLLFALQKSQWEEALVKYRAKHHKNPANIKDIVSFRQENRELTSWQITEITEDLKSYWKEKFDFRFDDSAGKIVSAVPIEQLGIDTVGIFRQEQKKDK